MRKVYGLLAVQLTITTIIGAVFMFTPGVKEFVQVRHRYITCYMTCPPKLTNIILKE